MVCPNCGSNNTNIVDSREIEKGTKTRRKRVCQNCGKIFQTFEMIEKNDLIVRKSDGSKETFKKDKAVLSIMTAARNTDLSHAEATDIVEEIYKKHNEGFNPEITTEEIKNDIIDYFTKNNKLICFNYRINIDPVSSFKELKNIVNELSEN